MDGSSIVPMRMFVGWEEFEPVREAYFQSFQDYYRLKVRHFSDPGSSW